MRASSFLRTCFNNAIWEQHIYKVACHALHIQFLIIEDNESMLRRRAFGHGEMVTKALTK